MPEHRCPYVPRPHERSLRMQEAGFNQAFIHLAR